MPDSFIVHFPNGLPTRELQVLRKMVEAHGGQFFHGELDHRQPTPGQSAEMADDLTALPPVPATEWFKAMQKNRPLTMNLLYPMFLNGSRPLVHQQIQSGDIQAWGRLVGSQLHVVYTGPSLPRGACKYGVLALTEVARAKMNNSFAREIFHFTRDVDPMPLSRGLALIGYQE